MINEEELYKFYLDTLNTSIENYKLMLEEDKIASASIFSKSTGVVSGIEFIQTLLKKLSTKVSISILKPSGAYVNRGDVIASITGPVSVIISISDTLIGLLENLSGIASLTNKYKLEIKDLNSSLLSSFLLPDGYSILAEKAFIDGGGSKAADDYLYLNRNYLNQFDSIRDALNFNKIRISRKIIVEVKDQDDLYDAVNTGVYGIRVNSINKSFIEECTKQDIDFVLQYYGDIDFKSIRAISKLGYRDIFVPMLSAFTKPLPIELAFYKRVKKKTK